MWVGDSDPLPSGLEAGRGTLSPSNEPRPGQARQGSGLRIQSQGPAGHPTPFSSCSAPPRLVESDLEIIGDQNCKWFESGTGDLNAETELELAGLGRGGSRGRARAEGPARTPRLSLGEAPAPAQPSWRLNLPRLTQPLPGMGGGGSAPEQWEEPTRVEWGARKGESGLGETGVGREFPSKKGVPPPHSRPPSRKEPRSPGGGTLVGERKKIPRLDKGKLRFIESLLCARHCARCFTYIITLNPHNNPAR